MSGGAGEEEGQVLTGWKKVMVGLAQSVQMCVQVQQLVVSNT